MSLWCNRHIADQRRDDDEDGGDDDDDFEDDSNNTDGDDGQGQNVTETDSAKAGLTLHRVRHRGADVPPEMPSDALAQLEAAIEKESVKLMVNFNF